MKNLTWFRSCQNEILSKEIDLLLFWIFFKRKKLSVFQDKIHANIFLTLFAFASRITYMYPLEILINGKFLRLSDQKITFVEYATKILVIFYNKGSTVLKIDVYQVTPKTEQMLNEYISIFTRNIYIILFI